MQGPATTALERVEKMPIYAREGVSHVWLVEPIAKTLEVFLLDAAARVGPSGNLA